MNSSSIVNTSALEPLPQIPKYLSVSCCLLLSLLYVCSLYVWNNKHDRDHPITVKRRFTSVFIVMLISPIFVYKFSSKALLERVPLWQLLGFRLPGLLPALVLPYLLTLLLFLGPVCVLLKNESLKMLFNCNYWKGAFKDLLWWRNHVIAPLSEEFVFRACMIPMMQQSFTPLATVFLTPLFFGTAHVHHIIERLNLGFELKTAIIVSCFQLFYTTVFGFYSAYLFARTGHFVSSFLAHAFCNFMGLPDLQDLWQHHLMQRILLIACYVVGLISWIFLLPIATQPDFYMNNIFWITTQT